MPDRATYRKEVGLVSRAKPEKMLPRFFLHIGELDTDPEGSELPDLNAARREAMLGAREMLAEWILHGKEDIATRIIITDAHSKVLAVVQIRDLLPRALREELS
jgi:hypothetical protein